MMTKKPPIIRPEDCWAILELAMSDALSDGRWDERALFNLRRAARIWDAGQYNEAGGWRDDRRAGKSGKRKPKATDAIMLKYALSLPASGGGRGHKSRWTLAAEKFNPEANTDEIANIARRLKNLNPTKMKKS
jgi:hypothetical protein